MGDPFQDALRRIWASPGPPIPEGPHPPEPSDEALLAYLQDRQGRRDEADAAMEAHLVACPECRRTLIELHRLLPSRTLAPAVRQWRWAAAAVLAASAAGWALSRNAPSVPVPALSAGAPTLPRTGPPPRPGTLWEAGASDAEVVLGDAIWARLGRGGALRIAATGSELSLERGAVVVESVEEPVVLRVGPMTAEWQEGTVGASREAEKPAACAWLASARADAGEGPCLVAFSARVRVTCGPEALELSPGQGVRLSEGRLVPGPGEAAWTGPARPAYPACPVRRVRDGEIALALPPPGPPARYVLEALVRKGAEEAEAGLLFPAGGGAWMVPLGPRALPADRWVRLRLEAGPEGCRLTAGGRAVASLQAAEMPMRLQPAEGAGVRLRAWGGEVEVRDVRRREER